MILNKSIVPKIIVIGIAKILYDSDSIIFRLSIDLNALVKPHEGHGILNIFLNKQGI